MAAYTPRQLRAFAGRELTMNWDISFALHNISYFARLANVPSQFCARKIGRIETRYE